MDSLHRRAEGNVFCFFFSSRRRHTRFDCDWSSDVCSSDLTLALVTDYDCWHPDHDSVTVELIIANLMQNAATAQKTIAEAVGRLTGPRTCACKDALATAIITRPEQVPDQTKRELAPIVGKYMK